MGTEKRERQKANRQLRLEQLAKDRRKAKAKSVGLRWVIGVVGALALVFGLVYAFGGDDTPAAKPTASTVGTPGTAGTAGAAECPKADGSSARRTAFTAAPGMCIDPAKSYTATFDTTEGSWTVALDTTRTPNTANNFVYLSRYHFYDGTKIFRADPSIDIIQGGGESPSSTFGYTIPDEGGKFTYQPGDFVMARTSAPNSAGAQWFFAGGPKVAALDSQGTYVTFGKVTSGLEVITKIITYADPTDPMKISKDVTINKVTITESDQPAPTGSSTAPGASTSAPATSVASSVATATSAPAATSAVPTTKA